MGVSVRKSNRIDIFKGKNEGIYLNYRNKGMKTWKNSPIQLKPFQNAGDG